MKLAISIQSVIRSCVRCCWFFPASIVSRAQSATETLTRLTNLTIRAGSLPKPLSASLGYLKEQIFPTKQLKLYHIFSFSTIPSTFKKMAALN
jgi:hypothetical protein